MDQLRQRYGDDGMVGEVGKLNEYSAKKKISRLYRSIEQKIRQKKENCALFRSCTTHTKKRSKYVKLGYGTLDLLKEFFLSHL